MRMGILLLISLVSLFLMTGCSSVEKSNLELATTEEFTELTVASEGAVQLQDDWTRVAELSVDMDGDSIEEMVTVEERSAPEGYSLRVTGKKGAFEKIFKGSSLTAESHVLNNGTHGHSLLIILNETETANDSQDVRFYEEKQGAYIFDFNEGELVPLYISSDMVSVDGKNRFEISLAETVLEIKDSISGMGVKFHLRLNEDQMKNIHIFDVQARMKLLNEQSFNRIFSGNDNQEVCIEKIIYGVMHQDVFAKIRLIYTFIDGRWQTSEEYMMTDNPEVYAVQKTASETDTIVWNMETIDGIYKADLETLLGYYNWFLDGEYAQDVASRLSVLYSELGARKILKGLGQVEEKHVKGIAKLLISERLIEFGEKGREELEKDFGALLSISAMSAEEAKALQLVMVALDETSEWMK